MIIIRTLRKDIANYNKEDDIVCIVCVLGAGIREGGGHRSGGTWSEGVDVVNSFLFVSFFAPFFFQFCG